MFKPRKISGASDWLDESGVKLYTISSRGGDVDQSKYLLELSRVKQTRDIEWRATPAFAIFHDGAGADYLVFAWWGNDNELFTSVSVKADNEWIEDPAKYSFCLYDLEVMWAERNIYIKTMDCSSPSLKQYQVTR